MARKGGRCTVAQHRDLLSAAQAQRGLGRSVIHQHLLFRDQLLHPRAAGVGKLRRQKLVQALAGVSGASQTIGKWKLSSHR